MAAHTLQPSGLVLRLGTYLLRPTVSVSEVFLTFICVCPEPVLINDRVFAPGLADLSEDASPDILGGATLGGINPWCETRPFWSHFHVKNDHFAKTGSGQTQGKLRTQVTLSRPRFTPAHVLPG
eukprot:COSAG06_NODE_2518_length_6729_cov_819.078733_8_plen_124_part_00